ncbi:unnamed protein product [Caenorhabditis auriculariae]|uniref:Uncharacterized protein n=1 Tax=Caenorhabditis auriculariae TaxID=2777116 RepID=A0A8S1H9D2_9PELO|nr:unnamed protein product [Caenorhabditis auriculariae]
MKIVFLLLLLIALGANALRTGDGGCLKGRRNTLRPRTIRVRPGAVKLTTVKPSVEKPAEKPTEKPKAQ